MLLGHGSHSEALLSKGILSLEVTIGLTPVLCHRDLLWSEWSWLQSSHFFKLRRVFSKVFTQVIIYKIGKTQDRLRPPSDKLSITPSPIGWCGKANDILRMVLRGVDWLPFSCLVGIFLWFPVTCMYRTTAAGFGVRIASRLLLSTTLLTCWHWGEGSLLYRLFIPPNRSMGETRFEMESVGCFSIIKHL